VWVGAGAADAGAVWIDAHADFQTRAAREVELRRALHRT
jgi:arginase family enzyme